MKLPAFIIPVPRKILIKIYEIRIKGGHLLLPMEVPCSSYSKYNVKFAFVIPITQKQVDPNIQPGWNIVAPSFMQVRKNESRFIRSRAKNGPFLLA